MSNNTTEVDDFNIKYWLFKVLGYWYLFLITAVFSTGIAYTYLRYTPKTYRVSSSILVADESSSNDLSIDALSGLTGGRRSFGNSDIESEISVIKSFDLIQSTLKELNFEVSYFYQGDLKDTEAFIDLPITVRKLEFEDQTNRSIFFDFTSGNDYSVYLEGDESQRWSCEFGKPCLSEEFAFVTSLENIERLKTLRDPLYIRLHDLDRLTVRYVNRLNVEPRQGLGAFRFGSNIIDIDISGKIIEKNTTFINTLVKAFIQYDLEQRNSTANNTIDFIDQQLSSITDSLISVEKGLEVFRSEKGIIDLSSKGALLLSQLTELENQKVAIDLNIEYYNFLSEYLSSPTNDNDEIVSPSMAGINDPILIELIGQLNVLTSEKIKKSITDGKQSLSIQGIDDQIRSIELRIQESIRNAIESSKLTYEQIERQLNKYTDQVSELPKNERELLTIQRQFNINNELYTFLLKKKSESEIARAGNRPKVKVLDIARKLQASLIGPAPKKVFLQANALGFISICIVLGMRFFFQTKISDIEQLKEQGKVTLLGLIPHIRDKSKGAFVFLSPKDPLSEAFRALRLNLDFIIPKKSSAKTIGITSAEGGEGKTFIALNLSQFFAIAGKKVLLIGVDLRKPKIQSELSLKNDIGLTNYFIGTAETEDIIQPSGIENLDVILSGPIPPNPAELIEGKGFGILMEKLSKQYDYIVCDGPPIGLVTDYLSVAPLVDTTLYVVRLNYSRLNSTELLNDYMSRGSIKGAHILVNDIKKNSSKRYGYGYGYGHETQKKGNLLSRLFKQ